MYDGKITLSWVGESDILPPSLAFNIFRIFQEIMFYALVQTSRDVNIRVDNKDDFCIKISGILIEREELDKLKAIELELRLPERKSEIKVTLKDEIMIKLCIEL
jgi:hypothetical protein